MTITIKTKCQNCGADILTEYIRVGLQVNCRNCLGDTVPQIPNGTVMPVTGQEIQFRDFKQLITEKAYRKEILRFFIDNFAYNIDEQGVDTIILNDRGEAIDQAWLHLKIQDSTELQHKLYQLAMSLWR